MGSMCSAESKDIDTFHLFQYKHCTKEHISALKKYMPSPPEDLNSDKSSGSNTSSTESANFEDNQNTGNEETCTDDVSDNAEHSSSTLNSLVVNANNHPFGQNSYIHRAIVAATAAVQEDKQRQYDVALKCYERCIDYLILAISTEELQPGRARKVAEKKMQMYMKRAEHIQEYLNKKKLSENSDVISDDDQMLINQIKSSILKERPNVKWSDVAALDEAKETLNDAVILPIKFPYLNACNKKSWKGILLHGPPGTGKSLLAKAIATEASSHTFFSVTPSHLVAKWLGETEKTAKFLFDLARRQKPSVIFIDEVDSWRTIESEGSRSDAVMRMKSEFYLQMQGINFDNDGVIVLGATSSPWNLDESVRRWFEKKIYIRLPDEKARLAILKLEIGNVPNSLNEDDFRILAMKTDRYSGKDIAVLVKDASMQPLKKIQRATHFLKVTGPSRTHPDIIVDDLLTPCSACPGAIEMSWMDIPGEKLLEPAVTMDDMLLGLTNVKPSVTDEDLAKMKKFMEDSGIESWI